MNENLVHITKEEDIKLIKKLEDITGSDYTYRDENNNCYKDTYMTDDLINMLYDLMDQYEDRVDELKEQENEYENRIDTYYRPLNRSEEDDLYGI